MYLSCRKAKLRIAFLFLSTLFLLVSTLAISSEPPILRPQIGASDVVFMYSPGDPTLYDAYKGTVSGWGGRASSREAAALEAFKRRVEEAHKQSAAFCGSVDFLVDFGGFIDFKPDSFMDAVSRGLDGELLQVPWLWDHKHKDHPAYWFCTNNPDYQSYLRDQAERACLAPIDGLHIDDYSGSSACSDYNGGCFCPYCMKGFREWLRKNLTAAQLKEKGVDKIKEFDYGAFLKSKGIDSEKYRKEHWKCPLINEFQRFQNGQMKQRITEIFQHAEKLRGMPLLRSINSSADSPRTLIPAPIIDYFCGEVGHSAASMKAPLGPIFVFKTVEALNQRQTATASGQDWAWIKANEKPGLVRLWIAQTYAFGSVFMTPHHQWCYTKELGTHWWNGKTEDFAWLYRFVRENKNLFDGMETLADAALIYSKQNYAPIRDAAERMSAENIPYAIVLSGNEELPIPLSSERLRTFSYFIKGNQPLNDAQADAVKRSQSQVVAWKGAEELPDALRNQVKVEGSDKIRISLRADRKNARIVCHVLNQDYDPEKDSVIPADVKIILDKKLLAKIGNKKIESAKLYAPMRPTESIPVVSNGNIVSFAIKQAGLWTILEF
ncbi:MAG: hypothetical protein AB1656_25425 [Candidatus Omnitrophota bacterium]